MIIVDASAQVKAAGSVSSTLTLAMGLSILEFRGPESRPVPYDLVKRIVANLVKERLAENPPLRAYARSSS